MKKRARRIRNSRARGTCACVGLWLNLRGDNQHLGGDFVTVGMDSLEDKSLIVDKPTTSWIKDTKASV